MARLTPYVAPFLNHDNLGDVGKVSMWKFQRKNDHNVDVISTQRCSDNEKVTAGEKLMRARLRDVEGSRIEKRVGQKKQEK